MNPIKMERVHSNFIIVRFLNTLITEFSMTVYDKNPNELISKTAQELEKVEGVKAPEWVIFVKTSTSRDRPPVQKNWWYLRSAAILRKIYLAKGPIGVSKLSIKFGGKKNRGHKPEKFYRGSTNIIRKILQQLEKAGLIEKKEVKGHKGRIITGKGKKFLNKIAK